MSETQRLLEAAAALSYLLRSSGVPHAFYGSLLTAVLANSTQCDASAASQYNPRFTNHLKGDFLYR